jgi:GTPase
MVMVEEKFAKATWEFTASVIILYHSTTIQPNYQSVVHCKCVRQSAKIVNIIGKDHLKTGDKCHVKFRFMYHPEYIRVGSRMVFREGRCKGLGEIIEVNEITQKIESKNDPNINK